MASENVKKPSTEPPEVKKSVRQGRRATTIGWTPSESPAETKTPSGRRKQSIVDAAQRTLFGRAARSSCDEVLPSEHWTSTSVEQPVKLQMGERTLGQKPITIMSVLRLNVEKYPDTQAYAYKVNDAWQFINFTDLFDLVRRAAKGFIAFGLQRFYGVAIIGRNAPEWAITNFAAIYAGGIIVPISPALSADECCNMIQNTQCSIIVVGSAKQLDTIALKRSQLINIKAIIKYGKDNDAHSVHFHTWDELLAMGDKVDDERLEERVAYQAPNLCCAIFYTPGASGTPKPVMMSQDNLVWTARTMGRRMSCSVASGRFVSIMPFCHVGAMVFDLYTPMMFASTVFFVNFSSPDVFEWTKQVNPTSIFAPYLIFEELRLKMAAHLRRSLLSRILFWWAMSIGIKGYRASITRRPMPCCWSVANSLVYEKVRAMLGLQSSREIFVSGRMIAEQTIEFFTSLNIPVVGIYGMTECAGPITIAAMPDMYRIASLGKDIDGCSTKIMKPDKNGVGDIRIRGRNIFMGYLNQPEVTNAAFDKEGWFITRDLIRRDDDGFLYYSGRAADVLTMTNGDTLTPEPIETVVRQALPIIRHCMVVGNRKAYLAVLLTIKTVVNWQTFEISKTLTPDSREWFQKLGYKEETIDKFLQEPDKRITNKIQETFDRLNTTLEPSHRIQKWTILPHDFTVQNAEITWTLRLRRHIIQEKYAETIDSMFIEK